MNSVFSLLLQLTWANPCNLVVFLRGKKVQKKMQKVNDMEINTDKAYSVLFLETAYLLCPQTRTPF